NRHDHRLKQGGQIVHLVIHLCLVVVCDLFQHAIQVTGLFTNTCHLDREGGKDVGSAHGTVELRTGRHVLFDLVHGVVEHHVASSAGDRVKCLYQRYPRSEGRGKSSRVTCDGSLVDNLTHNWSLQQGPILTIAKWL